MSAAKPQPQPSPPRPRRDTIDLINALAPLMWFVLALIAFFRLEPLMESAVKSGMIDQIKVGVIQLQLAHVSANAPDNAVMIAKEAVMISPEDRDRISKRFARQSENTKGARVLWVDDQHPYQNVNERRVLLAANMSVDLAKSTKEAQDWISRSNYDVVITDMDRPNDVPAICDHAPEFSNAGCALLQTISGCFDEGSTSPYCMLSRAIQGTKPPARIIYAANINRKRGIPGNTRVTNQAAELFTFILDALENRTPPGT